MARQLNPEVFSSSGERVEERRRPTEISSGDSAMARISLEINQIKAQLRESEKRWEVLNSRLTSLAEATKKTVQQVQTAQRALEEQTRHTLQDLKSRYSMMAGKMTENKVAETRTQELVDRHNQLVQAFEARLQQMQRLISQQEMKLLGYQGTLDQIRRELGATHLR